MDLTETKRPKRIVEVIEPNTTRVIEARQKRQEEERIKAEKEALERILAEKDEEARKNMKDKLEREKFMQQRLLEEELRRRIEEENVSNTLSGNDSVMQASSVTSSTI